MTYITSWEEFAKAAERLYLADPMKCCWFEVDQVLKLDKVHKASPDLVFIGDCLALLLTVRFVMKYRHCSGQLCLKITDNQVCLQYRTEHAQDVKKLEKLTSLLMRHMASKESHH